VTTERDQILAETLRFVRWNACAHRLPIAGADAITEIESLLRAGEWDRWVTVIAGGQSIDVPLAKRGTKEDFGFLRAKALMHLDYPGREWRDWEILDARGVWLDPKAPVPDDIQGPLYLSLPAGVGA
jgi:hypothetical protein